MTKRYFSYTILIANIISMGLCIAGYLLNIGWYRFLFGIILIPILLIHFIFHWSLVIKHTRISKQTELYSCLSNIAIALTLVLLPDVSDVPPYYAVFGLYKNPPDLFGTIALVSFVASFILTFIAKRTDRKDTKK
ncbi:MULTISPECIES: hypothetical protein [unclassified Coleofasciculus]|uniref:hypothetical protein n=1 Tax=unclassified Coleofasciculus TaxID=2692782 RepID=UPI0018814A77|nr:MULTISPECIES: hypothetical protein [unclassified Coleofasciculus]MBE9126194.1 hypothetical protein [Coleofasciculus sp. LEGE 07081]MBE9149599.1 hypothetical protein [Coleofasciculus sp. LEGE 07092]